MVAHTLKAQASLGEAIEGEQLSGFRLPALGLLQRWCQLQGPAEVGSKTTAGEASHLLAKPLPLQQSQCFGLDLHHPWLLGIPPGGS